MAIYIRTILKNGFFKTQNVTSYTSILVVSENHVRLRYLSSTATSTVKEIKARPISEIPGFKSYFNLLMRVIKKDFDSSKVHLMWEEIIRDFGPICRITAPGHPRMIAITNPDDVEKVYRVTMNNPVRNGFHSLKKIRNEATDDYFEKKGGLLIENNEEWWRVRIRVQTPMMRPKNIVRYLAKMDTISLEFMDRIGDFQKTFGEMPKSFQEELYKWSLESIGIVALNRRLGCLDPNLSSDSTQMKLIETVNKMFACLNTTEMELPWWRLFPSPTLKKLKECHEHLLEFVHSNVMETENELAKNFSEENADTKELTLLEILLQTEGLSKKDVVTFMVDFFFAGIDTTSHTLGFALYLLSRNKKAQKRLQEEVDEVLGDSKGPITETQLAKLSYLKACIKEALRVYPLTVGNVRTLEESAEIGGYEIPKGYQIFMPNIVTSRDEQYFKHAKEFIPERWERNRPLGEIHPYASLPFSHGTRMCIGRRVAEQEMYVFLARVMHRFNVDYQYKDMDMITRLVTVPSEPLQFTFTERR